MKEQFSGRVHTLSYEEAKAFRQETAEDKQARENSEANARYLERQKQQAEAMKDYANNSRLTEMVRVELSPEELAERSRKHKQRNQELYRNANRLMFVSTTARQHSPQDERLRNNTRKIG
jgi:lysyl-tRNA synthetase class I